MRLHRPATEDEMIALFLGEVHSPRYRKNLLRYLVEAGQPEWIITCPNLSDPEENRVRRALLDRHRGYSRREDVFSDVPQDIRWEWVWLTPEEVGRVRYLDYDYWIELSGGTGFAADAAPRIRDGLLVFGRMSTKWALQLAQDIANKSTIPPMILLAQEEGFVCLEGNARLTAYMLCPQHLPAELLVMVGTGSIILGNECGGKAEA